MSKGFLGIIALVILVFAGIFALSGGKTAAPSGSDKNSGSKTLTQHIEGQGKSGVTLVEYGDYQCPYCGQAYPTVKQAVADLNSQIYFQFRNFPLVSLHQNAFSAARAAEAAALQNKFWQMHDALYESQDQWAQMSDASPYFSQLAQQLGLDVTKFKADYASGKVNNLINADMAEGNALKVSGTPTFFLDGKQTTMATTNLAAFEKTIKDEIASKSHAQ